MKKETKTYFKNAVRAKGFVIDVINLILGTAILVTAVIALSGGEAELYLFPYIFLAGTILTCLNAIKIMKQNKLFGIFFIVFSAVLAIACGLSFVALYSGNMI